MFANCRPKLTYLFSGQSQDVSDDILREEVVDVPAVEVVVVHVIAAGQQVTPGNGHGLDGLGQVGPEVEEELALLRVAPNVAATGHEDFVFDGS